MENNQLRSPKYRGIFTKRLVAPYQHISVCKVPEKNATVSTTAKKNTEIRMDLQEESWRENSVLQRNMYLLDSELMADCTFVVGKSEIKKFRCHKLILGQGTSVFYAMFHGDLQETGEVKVDDIEPQHFRKMLEFIYTDDTNLENVETALSVCYAANKYMINTLILDCVDFVNDNLDPDVVCQALEFARLIDNADLEAKSLKYLKRNTQGVLKSTSFLKAERATLLTLLDQDHLCIKSEIDLFVICLHWAQANQLDAKLPLREVLGAEVLNRIRFLTVTAKEFVTHVVRSKLLSVQEERDILCFIAVGTGNIPPGFNTSTKNRANLGVEKSYGLTHKKFSLLPQSSDTSD